MGFDLIGNAKDANSEDEYFRNNVWWWRPLWNCVCDNAEGILTAEDMRAGHFNDCHHISKAKALRLGRRLLDLIEAGRIEPNKYQNDLIQDGMRFEYPFTIGNLGEFAKFCLRSGGFKIC